MDSTVEGIPMLTQHDMGKGMGYVSVLARCILGAVLWIIHCASMASGLLNRHYCLDCRSDWQWVF